jgi:hypothetical protein
VLGQVGLQPGTDAVVRGQRIRVDARHDGTQPEAGAARENSHAAARPEGAQGAQSVVAELGDGVRLVGLDEVEAMVDDAATLFGRRLRGADVEAPVHLPRVGGDHLGGDPADDEVLRERDGEPGLPGGGGAADDEERREPAAA